MKIQVTLYGGLAERVGRRDVVIEFEADDATVDDVLQGLVAEFPSLDGRLERVAYAVDDEIVDGSTRVGDGTQLALLPPVSGGC